MIIITSAEAKENFLNYVQEVSQTQIPIWIKYKTFQTVMVAEEDWDRMEKMLSILCLPRMNESIRYDMTLPFADAVTIDRLDW